MEEDATTSADERRRLIAEVQLERSQLLRNIETCRIRDIERPFIGEWSLKDIVGHVASWESEVITALHDLEEGRRPSLLDFDERDLNRWNQDHVDRKRSLNFWDLMQQLRAGRERLLAALEKVSDEEIADPGSHVHHFLVGLADHDRAHWHEIAARLAGMEGAVATGPESIYDDLAGRETGEQAASGQSPQP